MSLPSEPNRQAPVVSPGQLSFSVVIPAYNAGKFIKAAIESILHQTLPALEIIVIDDGSTDDTRERLQDYEGQIRYYFQNNQGIGASRNNGISRANGDWIALLDADDVWHPRKLECQRDGIGRKPAAGLIGTDSFAIDGAGAKLASDRPEIFILEPEPIPLRQLLETAVFCPSSVVIRKTCLEAIGGFSTQVQGSEDMLMWWTIGATYPVFNLRAALTGYRVHPNSISHNYLTMVASKKRAVTIAVTTLEPLQEQLWLRCLARVRVFREISWEHHCNGEHWSAIADLFVSLVNDPFARHSSRAIKRYWHFVKIFCRYVLAAFRQLVHRWGSQIICARIRK